MSDYKNKLGNLADKLKKEIPKTPIQEVQPIKIAAPQEPKVQFNNRIPKGLLRRLKAAGLADDISLQELTIQALENYLSQKAKPDQTTTKAD